MSDGEEEPTVEKSTDELLSETDDLLAGLEDDGGGGSGEAASSGGSSSEASSGGGSSVRDSTSDFGGEVERSSRERSSRATFGSERTSGEDSRRFRRYFDPKSAGISAVLVLAGALLGGLVPIPFVGGLTRLLAVGAATFVHGLTASDSRYAETFVASGVVGFLIALITTNMFVTLSGIGVPLLAVSTAATMLVALLGHYFGRDLRDGLTRDVGPGGGGGDDDVPGW